MTMIRATSSDFDVFLWTLISCYPIRTLFVLDWLIIQIYCLNNTSKNNISEE